MGFPLNFVATGSDIGPYQKGPYTYLWTLDDGTMLKGQSVSYTWKTAGFKNISLMVTDTSTGLTNVTVFTVHILGYREIYITIGVAPTTATINFYNTIQLTASSNLSGAQFIWSANNGTIDQTGLFTGTVAGVATVTVALSLDQSINAPATITVNAPPPTTLTLLSPVDGNIIIQSNATFTSQNNSGFRQASVYQIPNTTKILMVGDIYPFTVTSSINSYLYDYSNDSVSSTTNNRATGNASGEFNSCQLSNGDVIVSGGSNGSSGTNISARYSAVNGTWASTGNRQKSPYYGYTGYADVLLSSGKVFSASADAISQDNEIYDPIAGTWTNTTTQSVSTSYNNSTVALLGNGKVMRGPGISDSNVNTAIYDPVADSWSAGAVAPFGNGILFGMINGNVLFISQLGGTNGSYSVYTYSSNTWSSPRYINLGGQWPSLVNLSNGKVLIISNAITQIYDPVADLLIPYLGMNYNHAVCGACLASNSQVIVFGAAAASFTGWQKIELIQV